jgi:hypothetical protein
MGLGQLLVQRQVEPAGIERTLQPANGRGRRVGFDHRSHVYRGLCRAAFHANDEV